MFRLNYQSGDYKYISKVLVDFNDDDLLHESVRQILNVFECVKNSELLEAMLWAYENTPCSFCRSMVVSNLADHNMLPDAIRDEVKYDCCDDTKNYASKIKKESKETQK